MRHNSQQQGRLTPALKLHALNELVNFIGLYMPFSIRAGAFRPFVAIRDYGEHDAFTLQVGATTYGSNADDEQTYQTSYLEWGGRSDHLMDALTTLQGGTVPERLVRDASTSERRYVASDERNGLTAASLKTVEVEAEAA